MPLYKTKELFDCEKTIAAPLLNNTVWPWEALDAIEAFILQLGPTLPKATYTQRGENVWVANSATVAPTAFIGGPCIIDENAEIRHCAYIRGSAIVGKNAVVGNSTELKNCILFDGVQAPHYNYVGDSVLGHMAHLGAGAITSNVKSDKTPVVVKAPEGCADTGRKKVGAIVGDFTEVGCNSVLNPGTVLGRHCSVYPLSSVRGTVPAGSIYKNNSEIIERKP